MTLSDEYAAICGLTIPEFNSFSEERTRSPTPSDPSFKSAILTNLIAKGQLAPGSTLEDLKRMVLDWYDGYTWDGKTRVLNPWSVFYFFYREIVR